VSRSVPPHGLVIGNPARLRGVVTAGGEIVSREYKPGVYWTKDKSEKVEIKAEWMPKA